VSSHLAEDRLQVVESVFEAIHITGTTRVDTPISSVILSEGTRFKHRDVVNAFKTMDPGVRLILLMEQPDTNKAQEAMKMGFAAVLSLPFTLDELDQLISEEPHSSKELHMERRASDAPELTLIDHVDDSLPEETLCDQAVTEVERALEKARHQNAVRQKLRIPPESSTSRHHIAPGPSEAEIELVRSMVEQDQVIEQALERIRSKTGVETLHFIPVELAEQGALNPAESRSIHEGTALPISSSQGILGYLSSEQAAAQPLLEPWVEWLAQWLLLQMQFEELEQMAWTDHLTGAGNRRALERVLDTVLDRAREQKQAVTVMCFDIDDFKQYNDRFGHEAGDNVLCETVQLLRSVIRRGDHVFRVGGDEFVVVFADPSGPRSSTSQPPESIEQIAERFQQQVGNLQLPQIGVDAPGTLSISAGLVTFPWDGLTTRELLSAADKLALKSKRSGKNVITFGPTVGQVPPRPNQDT
jgi:diguanylate cyclase (GGDEF)-like protein